MINQDDEKWKLFFLGATKNNGFFLYVFLFFTRFINKPEGVSKNKSAEMF